MLFVFSSCIFFFQTDWSGFYAPGSEIHSYIQGIIDKYELDKYIKLKHELVKAEWNEEEGKWHLVIRRPAESSQNPGDESAGAPSFEEFEDTADFVFGGFGPLSRWSMPNIPGLSEFKGKLIHSADWEGEPGMWRETQVGQTQGCHPTPIIGMS